MLRLSTKFIFTFLLISQAPLVWAEPSALSLRVKRKFPLLHERVKNSKSPDAQLRSDLMALLKEGAPLLLSFEEATLPTSDSEPPHQSLLVARALLELVEQYYQGTQDGVLDAAPQGYLKILEGLQLRLDSINEEFAQSAFPYLVGKSALEIGAKVARLLIEKATEEEKYDYALLDQALVLLDALSFLADGRKGTQDYYKALLVLLTAQQDEWGLGYLPSYLKQLASKHPKEFAWVEDLLSHEGLQTLLSDAYLREEEIKFALNTLQWSLSDSLTPPRGGHNGGQALPYFEKKEELRERYWGYLFFPSEFKRAKGTEVLVRLGNDPRFIANLARLVEHSELPDPILVRLGERAVPFLIETLKNLPNKLMSSTAERLLDILAAIGKPAAAPLIELFENSEDFKYSRHLQVFEKWGKDEIPLFLSCFRKPDSNLWGAAYTVLVQIGEPALPQLLEATRSQNTGEATSAVRVIGEIALTSDLALSEFLPFLNDPREEIRLEGVKKLVELKKRTTSTLPSLLPLLEDPNLDMQTAAIQALGGSRRNDRS